MLLNLGLFDTDFAALDCQGKKGFTKGYNVKNIDATGWKAQIYAPKSNGCDHIGTMQTLSEIDDMPTIGVVNLANFKNIQSTGKMNI